MKHLTLIGCANGWQDAPDSDDESWGITSLALKRYVDRSFDMHDLTWTKEQWYKHFLIWMGQQYGRNYLTQRAEKRFNKVPVFFAKINELSTPLYSVRAYPNVPTSLAYPFVEVSQHFETQFFASTADFALALAIYEKFEYIDVYGFKMNVKSEYEHQVYSFNHWLGIAKGRGIKVKVHGESAILRTRTGLIYGYSVPQKEV